MDRSREAMESMGERASCLCYTTDERYLFPTLLSASQARRLNPDLRIFIAVFDIAATATESVSSFCETADLDVIFLRLRDIGCPSIMDARFHLDLIIPRDYLDFLHVDGDTQMHTSLSTILALRERPGRILAAPDPMSLILDRRLTRGGMWQDYFDSIGLTREGQDRYVNTGLLLFSRDICESLRSECRRIQQGIPRRLIFGQQDAFNIGFNDQTDLISFAWNFPAFLFSYGFHEEQRPKVVHFMSNPRPWEGHFGGWPRHYHSNYLDFARNNGSIASLYYESGRCRKLRYHFQQNMKRWIEARIWKDPVVRQRYITRERTTAA